MIKRTHHHLVVLCTRFDNRAKKTEFVACQMNVLPVLETRKVLLNHLAAKVWPLCHSKSLGREIASRIAFSLTDNEILHLLENERQLEEAVGRSLTSVCPEDKKHVLGEKLFAAVASVETELCAQVTGMLLELDFKTVEFLLNEPDALTAAVKKARNEYLLYTQSTGPVNDDNKSDEIGEALYDLVIKDYPDEELAARLTGMILELDVKYVRQLVRNPDDLREKLLVAHKALENAEESITA
ncbi:uncharacterized protein LOC126262403 isoform X2 [Schistocerca nitens]|uniref:uncharacterized protein LOC126262403 isoform X2 n=1 Tax=Schistocerca nitens TaxID=7011 RepID=UPI002118495B|nr:uncharacterized protein LOC126262403 isoform X2 [Schistocerca nitens]